MKISLVKKEKPVSIRALALLDKFESFFTSLIAAESAPISVPALAAVRAGGKRLRPLLLIISASLGSKVDKGKLLNACSAVELVHLASLVHDDVLDGSDTRRGVSTINANFGQTRAILIGDYLFGLAFRLLSKEGENRLIEPLAIASVHLSSGELRQRQTLRQLDQRIDEYLGKIYTKTAALFIASCLIGARLAEVDEATAALLEDYAGGLGMAFQIYDDILDFTGDANVLGKPIGNDIREGTVTLPMIYALNHDDDYLPRALNNPTSANIKEAVDFVHACGAIDSAREKAKEFVAGAIQAAGDLPDGWPRRDLISLGNFVIDRYH